MFTLGFFLWNVLGNASLRADRGGPQRRKLAVLMMAGMTIYTGLFPKTSAKAADTHAAVISVQEGHVAAEDVQQNV